MSYSLGIDIGTTYSAAGVARDGRTEIAGLGAIATVVPTVVYMTRDGDMTGYDTANIMTSL